MARWNHLLSLCRIQLENPRFVRLDENRTEIETIPSWETYDATLAIDMHITKARAAHASREARGPNYGFYVDLVNWDTVFLS